MKDHQHRHTNGDTAPNTDHFPRRMCIKHCCTTLFMDTVDATLARAARVFAKAVA